MTDVSLVVEDTPVLFFAQNWHDWHSSSIFNSGGGVISLTSSHWSDTITSLRELLLSQTGNSLRELLLWQTSSEATSCNYLLTISHQTRYLAFPRSHFDNTSQNQITFLFLWTERYHFHAKKNLLKGSQLDAFSPQAIVYCYLEFKLRYLKNLKLFSIRVKELSEPIVLWRKDDGF